MTDTHELTETLATAAAEAVRARRGAIEAGGEGVLRGITVEIETANGGSILDVTARLSWQRRAPSDDAGAGMSGQGDTRSTIIRTVSALIQREASMPDDGAERLAFDPARGQMRAGDSQ